MAYSYPPAHRHLEIAALIGSTVLLAALALDVALHGRTLTLLALPLGLATADLISGFTHWLADRYGSPRTPVFGHFVRTFREHHVDPRAITRHDFIETNGDTAIFVWTGLPLFVLMSGSTFAHAWLLALGLGSLLTSQIHKWAHMPELSYAVRALQRTGLVLSAQRHADHHAGAHDRGYCITTGWLNGPCDWARFFPLLERLARAVLRIAPGVQSVPPPSRTS